MLRESSSIIWILLPLTSIVRIFILYFTLPPEKISLCKGRGKGRVHQIFIFQCTVSPNVHSKNMYFILCLLKYKSKYNQIFIFRCKGSPNVHSKDLKYSLSPKSRDMASFITSSIFFTIFKLLTLSSKKMAITVNFGLKIKWNTLDPYYGRTGKLYIDFYFR